MKQKNNLHEIFKMLDESVTEHSHFIMRIDDYLSMVSADRKKEMIELWGSLPPAIEIMAGEISPIWESS